MTKTKLESKIREIMLYAMITGNPDNATKELLALFEAELKEERVKVIEEMETSFNEIDRKRKTMGTN